MKASAGEGRGSPCYFREVQHFRQIWLWLLLAGIAGIAIWGFVQQIIIGRPFGQNPAPDAAVAVIALVFGLGFPILFYAVSLTAEVRPDGLYYRYFPFHRSFRRIPADSLVRFAPHTYSPIKDYGGWGIRYGRGGKAYNVSGNRGVMLEFLDGKKLLIGSRRPEALAEAMGLAFGRKPGETPGR